MAEKLCAASSLDSILIEDTRQVFHLIREVPCKTNAICCKSLDISRQVLKANITAPWWPQFIYIHHSNTAAEK